MSRPQLIRADTIDLQDQTAPSAQDHTRQPTHPGALGAGPPAPHQAETLREVAAEAEEEQHRSPRVSADWPDDESNQEQQQYGNDVRHGPTSTSSTGSNSQQQDNLAVAQNGGLTGAEDADMADAEGDDGMDDDMMDKISSSPSIDDGGYPFSVWPARTDSLSPTGTSKCSLRSFQAEGIRTFSPFVERPDYYPPRRGSLQSTSRVVMPFQLNHPFHFQTASHNRVSSDHSISSGMGSSTYTDERRDVLAPLPGDMINDCAESSDEDFGDSSMDAQSTMSPESTMDEYFEVNYDDSTMIIPYESSEDEYDDSPYPEERFVDSGWGGEYLQDLEDIDFEFVYALHTFVATVEGQANATKGDTMVLLDDSNSYWWLVRVVKDSSIGYLPAEHIETPTERLARLNKHRNIDLSATMLGDQAEKTKNPLKKAIRRRNAKTVTFAAPTYVEASDIDYSTEEEDGDGDFYAQDQQQAAQQAEAEDDQTTLADTSSERAEVRDVDANTSELAARKIAENGLKTSSEIIRTSDEIFDGKTDNTGKSRNGTVRNTDSFFKDDTVETRKITLTPNLLRDDSSTSTTRTSNDSKEIRQRPSIDKLEKEPVDKGKDDKKKKDKKEKDKKPGMLSHIFSRKKKRIQDEDIDELIYGKKGSSEDARLSPAPSNESEEFATEEQVQVQSSPQRQPSKLQKQPRNEASVGKQPVQTADTKSTEPQQAPAPTRPPPATSAVEPSMRLVQPEGQGEEVSEATQKNRVVSPELSRGPSSQNHYEDPKSGGAFSKILRSRSQNSSEPKPEKVKKAKIRSELDDFDSSAEASPIEEPFQDEADQPVRDAPVRPSIPGAYPDSYLATPVAEKPNTLDERLSESPVQVSPVEASRSNPPALMIDTSSQEDAPSPVSSPSPELVNAEEIRGKKGSGNSTSSPASTSTWNDAHLRTFFDDDSDIKDLLVVVYDKSGVVPAGPDHPITGNLFREENAKLADITTRLDGMLGDWLARKSNISAR